MRWILIASCLFYFNGYGQLKSYIIGVKGDTLNRVDLAGQKQGKWVTRYDEVRGEPGYEEEGAFIDSRKEGIWRKYTLRGDMFALETYRWGFKDGACMYFNMNGDLLKEESWKALNPDKAYDTIDVEDVDRPGQFKSMIVKNEGASLKHGQWKYYDPATGFITKQEFWVLNRNDDIKDGSTKKNTNDSASVKAKVKPKEVLDFEKKNAGKKKVKVRDGNTF
jgi:hypothetical protein